MKPLVPYTVTEISVVYRPSKPKKDAPVITTSNEAYQCIIQGFNPDTLALKEEFVVLYLNRANRVIGLYKASSGGVTGTVADPRLILATALKVAASSIVLSHNHPSGNLKPSRQDEELTNKINQAAKLHDLKVLDHLILDSEGNYYSFADEGLL